MRDGWRTFSVTADERVGRPPVAKALSHRWAIPATSDSKMHRSPLWTRVMVVRRHNSRACTRRVFIFADCIKVPVLKEYKACLTDVVWKS